MTEINLHSQYITFQVAEERFFIGKPIPGFLDGFHSIGMEFSASFDRKKHRIHISYPLSIGE